MNSRYEVSSLDVCVQGFERLRNQSEFLLLASIDADTDAASLLEQWEQDIQSCERFEGFDYDAARNAVRSYWELVVRPLFAGRKNPFNLEPCRTDLGLDEFGDGEGCTAFLYVEVSPIAAPCETARQDMERATSHLCGVCYQPLSAHDEGGKPCAPRDYGRA